MSTVLYHHIQFMHPRLESKYLRLQKSRNILLDELEAYEDIFLNASPADGKWSVNQTIAHLIQVEELTISYIQNKISKEEELFSASLLHEFRALLLKLALKSGIKFKAPPVVATVPDTAYLPSLRQKWETTRFKMEDVLTEFPPHLMDKCIFKHPYAGPLSINQTLHFLQDHFDHHLHLIRQIAQLPNK